MNQPDMAMVGVKGDINGGNFPPSQLEQRSHFGLWCVLSSPLTLSLNLADKQAVDAAWPIITNGISATPCQALPNAAVFVDHNVAISASIQLDTVPNRQPVCALVAFIVQCTRSESTKTGPVRQVVCSGASLVSLPSSRGNATACIIAAKLLTLATTHECSSAKTSVELEHCTPDWAGDKNCTLPSWQAWYKPLSNGIDGDSSGGAAAVIIINHGASAEHISLDLTSVPGISCASCHVFDVWKQVEDGMKSKLETTLESHDSLFITIKA